MSCAKMDPALHQAQKPPWIKVRLPSNPVFFSTKALISDLRLHTVCESAQCPNRWECWSQGTATFMIAGDRCTRACGFFSAGEICEICTDPSRSTELLCVVEQPTDILPLEKTNAFRGRYHSLGGKISPLDHIGPDDLRIGELLKRVDQEKITEIIFALPADVEGESTTNYIVDLLKNKPVNLTRIARGIPAGGGLESADELTLSAALTGRTKL